MLPIEINRSAVDMLLLVVVVLVEFEVGTCVSTENNIVQVKGFDGEKFCCFCSFEKFQHEIFVLLNRK